MLKITWWGITNHLVEASSSKGKAPKGNLKALGMLSFLWLLDLDIGYLRLNDKRNYIIHFIVEIDQIKQWKQKNQTIQG